MKEWQRNSMRGILAAGSFFACVTIIRSILTIVQKQDSVKERQNVYQAAVLENEKLKKELVDVQSQTFVEKEAREKLGMTKKGEAVVILPDNGATNPGMQTTEKKQDQEANWKRWWRLFF